MSSFSELNFKRKAAKRMFKISIELRRYVSVKGMEYYIVKYHQITLNLLKIKIQI